MPKPTERFYEVSKDNLQAWEELNELLTAREQKERLTNLLIEQLEDERIRSARESHKFFAVAMFIESNHPDLIKELIEYAYSEGGKWGDGGETPIGPYIAETFGDNFDLSEFPLTKADFPKSSLC